jgi:ribosomal protein S18 acetylase RimI-like enzyme
VITFERIVEENLYIAKEMIDSNSTYFEMEQSKSNMKSTETELLASNQTTYLIKVEDTYIGLTSYRDQEEEKLVSISLLIIHADYQGFGYGTTAYYELENLFVKNGFKKIILKVRIENNRAIQFWERNGFLAIGHKISHDKDMICFEKVLA